MRTLICEPGKPTVEGTRAGVRARRASKSACASGTRSSTSLWPESASAISWARSTTAGGNPAMRATSIPNERDELPGCTRCEKTGAPPRRGVLDRGDVVVGDEAPVFGQRAQLVKVRREKYHRRLLLESEQKLADRLRDREAVERAGAAADLVDQQQRPVRAASQDVRRFGHLQVERRLPRCEVVAGADAREDPVDGPERHCLCRHERADLRGNRQQADLPQIRRFSAHVRSG